jgi:UDP-glucose 4-epimerase
VILVLGGAGYVGSHAAKAVAEAGRQPVVIDSLSAGHASSVQWGPLIECDLRDTQRLSEIMEKSNASSVMHFAASIEVGIGEREPLALYDNNVCGTVSVLKAMAHARIDRIVISSKCAVYGAAQSPLHEGLPRNPASVYGRTKSMVESILEDCSQATGLKVAILRYFNASGADPSGLIGEQHNPETHLIPNDLKAAAGLSSALKSIWHRLSHARWHMPARLRSRQRFGGCTRCRAFILENSARRPSL